MATDLSVTLEDRPGTLARLGQALGGAGVNIEGSCLTTGGGRGEAHLLVEDAGAARTAIEGAGLAVSREREVLVVEAPNHPGELGRVAKRLADAGVNIELAYVATGDRLVFGVDDEGKARGAV
jgi:hypothetical protein